MSMQWLLYCALPWERLFPPVPRLLCVHLSSVDYEL